MRQLCDTNVLSELARPAPNAGALRWARQVKVIGLSSIVVDEICFGLGWRPNPRIQAWLDAFLQEHCVILPVTEAIARRSGGLRGRLRASGSTRSHLAHPSPPVGHKRSAPHPSGAPPLRARTQADMLIAATAIEHNLTLVTRNTRDFEGCGLSLLDPFD